MEGRFAPAPASVRMARKWSNENLPGTLHYVTGNVNKRLPIFLRESNCIIFLQELQSLKVEKRSKLICFVLMPDHFHLIVNPQDGNIREWVGALKSLSARRIVKQGASGLFTNSSGDNQVWQESFKAFPLWSNWMIWQKINYIHANPLKAKLVDSTRDYPWSSFRSFYNEETDPMFSVDKDWWYEDDAQELKTAMLQLREDTK